MNPTTGIANSCARAVNDHAVAPLRKAITSRRRIVTAPLLKMSLVNRQTSTSRTRCGQKSELTTRVDRAGEFPDLAHCRPERVPRHVRKWRKLTLPPRLIRWSTHPTCLALHGLHRHSEGSAPTARAALRQAAIG